MERPMYHLFRSESELQGEAKGGYLEMKIQVPEGTQKVKFSLKTKDGSEHRNMIHVTHLTKKKRKQTLTQTLKEKKKMKLPMDQQDRILIIRSDLNGDFGHIDVPHYYKAKDEIEKMVGHHFWNSQTRELTLGKNGLRLTIVKDKQRGSGSPVSEENMDFGKCIFVTTFQDANGIELDRKERFLFDQDKYLIKPGCFEVLPRRICCQGKQYLKVSFQKVHITKDKKLRLSIYPYDEFECWEPLTTNISCDKFNGTWFEIDMSSIAIEHSLKDALARDKLVRAKVRIDILDEDIPENREDLDWLNGKDILVQSHEGEFCICADYQDMFGEFSYDDSRKRSKSRASSDSGENSKKSKVSVSEESICFIDVIEMPRFEPESALAQIQDSRKRSTSGTSSSSGEGTNMKTGDGPVPQMNVRNIASDLYVKDGSQQTLDMPHEENQQTGHFGSFISDDFFNYFDPKFLAVSALFTIPAVIAHVLSSYFGDK